MSAVFVASASNNLYAQLEALPARMIGEIMNGRLYAQPRPGSPHAAASSALGGELYNPYHRGRSGPGGWWILDEPELHFIRDTEVVVPDLAGWRRQRMPHLPQDHRFEIVPDWVCEVISPTSVRIDRITKMPLYARYGVPHCWLVDPLARTLEVFALRQGLWTLIGLFQGQDQVSIEPFADIALDLSALWSEAEEPLE